MKPGDLVRFKKRHRRLAHLCCRCRDMSLSLGLHDAGSSVFIYLSPHEDRHLEVFVSKLLHPSGAVCYIKNSFIRTA